MQSVGRNNGKEIGEKKKSKQAKADSSRQEKDDNSEIFRNLNVKPLKDKKKRSVSASNRNRRKILPKFSNSTQNN